MAYSGKRIATHFILVHQVVQHIESGQSSRITVRLLALLDCSVALGLGQAVRLLSIPEPASIVVTREWGHSRIKWWQAYAVDIVIRRWEGGALWRRRSNIG